MIKIADLIIQTTMNFAFQFTARAGATADQQLFQ